MSNTFNSSVHALAQAILDELVKAEENLQHGAIYVSYNDKSLPNGIKHCTVQIECNAGCGWLIEAFEGEAEALEQKAIAIQKRLQGLGIETLTPLPDILLAVFPEFVIERQATVLKSAKEPKFGGHNG
jgi:hypothetical protein